MQLQDMKMNESEMKQYEGSVVADAPKYPYGLRIDLNQESLKKLGILSLPRVGDEFMLHAKVEVCCTSENENIKGEMQANVGLQIMEMALEKGPSEKSTEAQLYG